MLGSSDNWRAHKWGQYTRLIVRKFLRRLQDIRMTVSVFKSFLGLNEGCILKLSSCINSHKSINASVRVSLYNYEAGVYGGLVLTKLKLATFPRIIPFGKSHVQHRNPTYPRAVAFPYRVRISDPLLSVVNWKNPAVWQKVSLNWGFSAATIQS